MNSPVSAPTTPPVRSQEGRQAPSTPMKQSVQCTRRVHARLERERKPKRQHKSQRGVRGHREKSEAKQQQDWRLVLAPTAWTNSSSTKASTGTLLSREHLHLLARDQPRGASAKGPGLARTWLSAMLKRKCLLTANAADVQETTRNVAASHEGRQAPNRMRELRRECPHRYATAAQRLHFPLLNASTCVLAASAALRAGWRTQRLQAGSCEKVLLHPTSGSTALKEASCLRRSPACACSFIWRCPPCKSHVKVRRIETGTETETKTQVRRALCTPLRVSSLCPLVCTPCVVGVVRCDTSAATLRMEVPVWQCAACKVRSFLSRDPCRGCNKQKDEAHDEYINEWA